MESQQRSLREFAKNNFVDRGESIIDWEYLREFEAKIEKALTVF